MHHSSLVTACCVLALFCFILLCFGQSFGDNTKFFPVTVRQITNALSGTKELFGTVLEGDTSVQFKIVGRILSRNSRTTTTSFEVTDHTGTTSLTYWGDLGSEFLINKAKSWTCVV